ncbi:Cellulose synthase-like protein E6 [Camellia lanceoleosa]|uniref:Cellulose synthase-like protein E6 n=1 Tax=Camellia lanceoleosa TaxID=1840588 RepID=A0ACC0HXF7_9ERIC|nr:Cellulose synthase-like protein E6 [Camellia lanceoleosa]
MVSYTTWLEHGELPEHNNLDESNGENDEDEDEYDELIEDYQRGNFMEDIGQLTLWNLTHLELGVIYLSKVMLDLLSKMPNLESLKLIMDYECYFGNDEEKEFYRIQWHAVPCCLLSHLKVIEIDNFRGRENDLLLVEYFLKNAKIKETMEKAFLDDITESMKQDEPNYDRVVELMREVRDGFCEMAPQSWKEEIFGAIDLDILSQEDELKVAHLKLLKELAKICRVGNGSNQSYIVALIKGAGTNYGTVDILGTADAKIETLTMVINTVLSVMSYNYPPEKLSIYLSDDGGSEFTFYALMETSQFSKHWIPFCKKFRVEPRSPAAYFSQNFNKQDPKLTEEWLATKKLYEDMKFRIEAATEKGNISKEVKDQHKGFLEWNSQVTKQDDQSIVQILIDGRKLSAVDDDGHQLPTLVYLAREKRPQCPHNFKAGP